MQVENEYKNVEAAFHEKGPSYVRWAALMAVNLQTGVPWVMCKQDDAPDPVVSSLVLQCLAFSDCCFKGNPPFSGLKTFNLLAGLLPQCCLGHVVLCCLFS